MRTLKHILPVHYRYKKVGFNVDLHQFQGHSPWFTRSPLPGSTIYLLIRLGLEYSCPRWTCRWLSPRFPVGAVAAQCETPEFRCKPSSSQRHVDFKGINKTDTDYSKFRIWLRLAWTGSCPSRARCRSCYPTSDRKYLQIPFKCLPIGAWGDSGALL